MKSTFGLLVSWLAAWCQVVVVAAMPLAPLIARADPLGNVPICHGGADQNTPSQPSHDNHECVLCCAICLAHGWSVAVLASAPAVPASEAVSLVRFAAAQPRAPPLRRASAAQPRGPPSLI